MGCIKEVKPGLFYLDSNQCPTSCATERDNFSPLMFPFCSERVATYTLMVNHICFTCCDRIQCISKCVRNRHSGSVETIIADCYSVVSRSGGV